MAYDHEGEPSARRGAEGLGWIVVGAVLVMIGALLLLGQSLDVDVGEFGWPFFVIVPGVILVAFGVARGENGRAPLMAGSVVTATGLVLLYQNTTDRFETWAYAWALVAMVGPGLGELAYGKLQGHPETAAAGLRKAFVGIAFFALGLVFFELVIGIGGEPGPLRDVGLPILLIALGLWAVVGGYVTRRR